MISGSDDHTVKLVCLLPISTAVLAYLIRLPLCAQTWMLTRLHAADWYTFTLSLDVDSIDSSFHAQLVLCCNNDREKCHFCCGEGTFELAAKK